MHFCQPDSQLPFL